jgi:RimJ/RimL family protein N-acetyltransferase
MLWDRPVDPGGEFVIWLNRNEANHGDFQGVATLLMENCFSWAKIRGYQKAYLTCYAANAGAIDFYRKTGFPR